MKDLVSRSENTRTETVTLFTSTYTTSSGKPMRNPEELQVLKWNSTEMACAYRSFDSGNSVRLICAYNARGDVVGQQIYEEGNGTCEEGTQCGDNGTCVYDLCRVPTTNPDVLLPIYNPSLTCSNSALMSQFSRYYALNMHNYFRRLVASGWAQSKLTLFTPRAAGMGAVSYDCSLEETATDSAKKCESSFTRINKYSMDGGINRAVIKETNISKEGALELAMSEWFSELQRYDVKPSSALDADSTALNITNIMHDKYRRVGCAVNKCAKGFTVVECRYDPMILQNGDAIYAEGPPCSKCEKSEKCIFGVLCQT
ncbi:hypothetical protein Q1695_004170 [Nippostrongylus brasiliensis]|nr:hypothetical protein Q1695_004170 [Nippostrongylus brasiliensis]